MTVEPLAVPTGSSDLDTRDGVLGWGWRRRRRPANLNRVATKPPLDVVAIPRMLLAVGMGALSALTLGGAVLMLLVWRQSTAGAVATDEIDRVWNLFEVLATNERAIAVVCVPAAAAWMAIATVNVRRATCQRRNPIGPTLVFLLVPIAVWRVSTEVVMPAAEWWIGAAGVAAQGMLIGLAMLSFEYVAHIPDAPRRPARAACLLIWVAVAHVQFLGGLGTTTAADVIVGDEWGQLAAYLGMLAVLQAMAALAVNEAFRSLEDSTLHRHELRKAFGSALTMVGSLRSARP